MHIIGSHLINDGIDITSPDYLRSRISLICLGAAVCLLCFFSYINYNAADYDLALFEVFLLLMGVSILIDYYKHHNLKRMTTSIIALLYLLFIPLIVVTHNHDYTLIWSIFFPIFAILTKGRKTGTLHTILFYLIILTIAYQGIGEWVGETWNFRSFLRFTMASMMLSVFIYLIVLLQERTHRKLQELLKREEQHIAILEKLSQTDPLTSLYNRRFLHQIFPDQFNLAKRHGFAFGFFIMDIDYFKRYNDTHGHQEGDNALKKIAAIFQAHMRRGSDYAFRLGGEEFGGIIVAKHQIQITSTVTKIKHAIEQEGIIQQHDEVLTVSIGVLILTDLQEHTFDAIYAKADAALYRAKDQGRNRIVIEV